MPTNPKLVELRKLVRMNDTVLLRFSRDPSTPSWSTEASVEVIGIRKVKDEEVRTTMTLNGFISPGHDDERTIHRDGYYYKQYPVYSRAYMPTQGVWLLYGCMQYLRSAVRGMPSDLEPRFDVRLDSGTNQLSVERKIHGDSLVLRGYNAKAFIDAEFIIDEQIGLHNSARFGNPLEQFAEPKICEAENCCAKVSV